ncbi:hypothetical protein WS67_15830 [Burkholderia singularis]|uniref:Uncharacterized protein n=1 Tax=Burkholderia singularis TaxID=1503053 RepID=A0A103E0Z3_9BURK|nr:hypothetical protein WS67_15830 [Burkholderia singularis]
MLRNNVTGRALMLPPLLLLLTACASKSPCLSSAPAIPPLPPEVRQPATPSICLPTCSAGLMHERESWRASLMNGASPAGNVKPITTR